MSPADAVWLRGDSPGNRVVISAVLWSDAPVDVARLRARVAERILARHPVFGRRAVPSRLPGTMPRWEEVADLDLHDHVHEASLPAPGDHATLERVCSEERSTPLDPDRPLWTATVHQGYRGVGSAVHVRLHHSLGDGMALMQLLMTLVDEFDPALVPLADEVPRGDRVAGLVGRGVGTATDLALRPWRGLAVARDLADTAAWGTRLLLPTRAPRSALQGRPAGRKRMAWSPDGLAASDLVTASHDRGVTVNDLLLAVMAGGMHRYLAERDAVVDEVLVVVPISLRELGAPLPRSVGNRIGLLPVLLPVGDTDHDRRVQLIRERTAQLKSSKAPAISHALMTGTTLLTPGIERAVHRVNQRFGTGVVTNVIGPDLQLHLVGAPIRGVIGWGGVTGDLNLGAGFISLGGRVFGGVVTDAAITPDPDRLMRHLEAEWRTVLPAAAVGPAPTAMAATA